MMASDTNRLEVVLQDAADHTCPTPARLFDASARLTLLKFLSERLCKALHGVVIVDSAAICMLNACKFAGCSGDKQTTYWK